jgi:hypothetical protein
MVNCVLLWLIVRAIRVVAATRIAPYVRVVLVSRPPKALVDERFTAHNKCMAGSTPKCGVPHFAMHLTLAAIAAKINHYRRRVNA